MGQATSLELTGILLHVCAAGIIQELETKAAGENWLCVRLGMGGRAGRASSFHLLPACCTATPKHQSLHHAHVDNIHIQFAWPHHAPCHHAAPQLHARSPNASLLPLVLRRHYLFGTDCYTQALLHMRKDCRAMGEEERARLAFSMTRCFLIRASGVKPPDKCPDSVSVAKCTEGMHDRAFNAYTQFYTNIHTVSSTCFLMSILAVHVQLPVTRQSCAGAHFEHVYKKSQYNS